MQAPIACVTRALRLFGRLSGSQPSAWIWAWSWDPLRFARRYPSHHLSPARAKHPAGLDPEAHLSRSRSHSNAPIKGECQSILSKIVAHFPQGLRPFLSRRSKKRGPFQLVPVIAKATLDRPVISLAIPGKPILSPRWLMIHGHPERAHAIVDDIERS